MRQVFVGEYDPVQQLCCVCPRWRRCNGCLYIFTVSEIQTTAIPVMDTALIRDTSGQRSEVKGVSQRYAKYSMCVFMWIREKHPYIEEGTNKNTWLLDWSVFDKLVFHLIGFFVKHIIWCSLVLNHVYLFVWLSIYLISLFNIFQ